MSGLGKTNTSDHVQNASNDISHTTQQSNSVSASATSAAMAVVNQQMNFNMVPLAICSEDVADALHWGPDNYCVTGKKNNAIREYMGIVNEELDQIPETCCLHGYALENTSMPDATGKSQPFTAATTGSGSGMTAGKPPPAPSRSHGAATGAKAPVSGGGTPKSYKTGGVPTVDKTRCALAPDGVSSGYKDVCSKADRSKPPPAFKKPVTTGTGAPTAGGSGVHECWYDGTCDYKSADSTTGEPESWQPCVSQELYQFCGGPGSVQEKARIKIGVEMADGPSEKMLKYLATMDANCKKEAADFYTNQEAQGCEHKGVCCMEGCNITLNQKGTASATAVAQLKQKSTANFSATTHDTLSNQLKSLIKQANQGGVYPSLIDPSSNSSHTNQSASNSVKTAASQSNDVSASASSSAVSTTDQIMNINIPSSCINSNFTADQDGAAKAAAQTQVYQTSEAMMKTANMTKLSNDLKSTTDQSNKGWDPLGDLKGFIVIIVIVVLAVIFLPIIAKATKGQRQQNQQASQTNYQTAYTGMSIWFAVAAVMLMLCVLCVVEVFQFKKKEKPYVELMKEAYTGIKKSRSSGKDCKSGSCSTYCPRPSAASAANIKDGKCKVGDRCCELPDFDANLFLYSDKVQRQMLPADDFRCTAVDGTKNLYNCSSELSNLRPGAVIQYFDPKAAQAGGPGGEAPALLVLSETLDSITQQVKQQLAAIGNLETQIENAPPPIGGAANCEPPTRFLWLIGATKTCNNKDSAAGGTPGVGGAWDMTFLANLAFWKTTGVKNASPLLTGFTRAPGITGLENALSGAQNAMLLTATQQKALVLKGFDPSQKGAWYPGSDPSKATIPSISGFGAAISRPLATGNTKDTNPFPMLTFAPKDPTTHTVYPDGLTANMGFIAPKQIYLDMFKQIQIYYRYSEQGKGADGHYGDVTNSYLVYELNPGAKWPIGFKDKTTITSDELNKATSLTADHFKFGDTPTPQQVSQAVCYLTTTPDSATEYTRLLFPTAAGIPRAAKINVNTKPKADQNPTFWDGLKSITDTFKENKWNYVAAPGVGFAPATGYSVKTGLTSNPIHGKADDILGAFEIKQWAGATSLKTNGPPLFAGPGGTATGSRDSESFGTQSGLWYKYSINAKKYKNIHQPRVGWTIASICLGTITGIVLLAVFFTIYGEGVRQRLRASWRTPTEGTTGRGGYGRNGRSGGVNGNRYNFQRYTKIR